MEREVYQNENGVRRTVFFDRNEPDKFTVHTEADMDQIIKENEEIASKQKRFSNMTLLARAPMTVYEQSVREGWDPDDWRKWMNKPENAPFRVWKGQV